MWLQHRDLHAALTKLAIDHGAKIRYSSLVRMTDLESGALTLDDGERIYADLIVGEHQPLYPLHPLSNTDENQDLMSH